MLSSEIIHQPLWTDERGKTNANIYLFKINMAHVVAYIQHQIKSKHIRN